MQVYDAIRQRRTIKQYTARPIPRELIERLLDAAVWAPNHHLTEPWRFAVLTGAAKDHLAILRRQQVREAMADPTTPGAVMKLEETYRKMAGAAALVVVTARHDPDPHVDEENRLATAAATQNLLLTATEEGLASFWSSGVAPYQPARAFLGVPDDEVIVAVVHLGYTEHAHPGRRRAARELTRWLDAAPTSLAGD